MKTKELIKLLQEEDPTGEGHVVVGNVDIHFVCSLPAYYDGAAQMVIRDGRDKPVKGKYCRNGDKIQIYTSDFNSILWDNTDFTIDYSELNENSQKRYKENHDKIREASKNMDYKHELEHFTEWFKEKALKLVDNYDDIEGAAKAFFDAHLSPYDKIPPDIPVIGESYISRRKKQWDQQLEITYDSNGFCIKNKTDM